MAAKLLTIAFRNMRRQLRRTILTGLTFAIAVFIYTVLVAVPWSMDRIADNASKGLRLVVTERNNGRLPARYCGPIKTLPHVLGCAPEILWGAIYRDPKDPIITYGINGDIASVTGSSDYQPPPDMVKLSADGPPQRDGWIRADARERMENRRAGYAAQSRRREARADVHSDHRVSRPSTCRGRFCSIAGCSTTR